MKTVVLFVVAYILFAGSSAVRAEDSLVFGRIPHLEADRVLVADILASPTMQQSGNDVAARAEQKVQNAGFIDPTIKATIVESLKELPFHRIIDVEFTPLTGLPDVVSFCLEAHPVNELSIEACASTMIFISSLLANVKYRWDVVLHQSSNGHIHELSVGPGFGIRKYTTICFDSCGTGGLVADMMGSLEYVYWISNHFGLKAQLDIGASYILTGNELKSSNGFFPFPTGRLTLGLAF